MEDKIIGILADTSGVPAEKINRETQLVGDLGMSSFDLADIVVRVEEEYGIHIPDERFPELQTVEDVIRLASEVR